MTRPDLRLCRSLLFLPASNPRAIEKARSLAADMVIFDLEDAVKPEDKQRARDLALAAAAEGGGRAAVLAIRINGPGVWQDADIAAVRASGCDYAILPKAETSQDVARVAEACGKPLLAMIETARGVLAAVAIATVAEGLIVGTNDLAADLGLPPSNERGALVHALQATVLAARAAGIAVFDGVYNRLDDADGLAVQCSEGRAFGFDGKSLIHPAQIETANRIFGPSAEEVEAALRLIAAAGGGAERFEGRMIEGMHVAQAQAVLAKARR